MLARARRAIELHAFLETNRNREFSRQPYQIFDAIAVAAFRNNQRVERPIGLERFAYGVNASEAVHEL
jgi:hypothetical protein